MDNLADGTNWFCVVIEERQSVQQTLGQTLYTTQCTIISLASQLPAAGKIPSEDSGGCTQCTQECKGS